MFSVVTACCAQWIETRDVFRGTDAERTADVPYYYPYTEGPDFGWGFFYDYGRLPATYRTAEYQRKCFRQMAAIGMNTTTIYGWHGGQDLADVELQLTLAKEEGLGERPIPILVCASPADVQANLHVPSGSPELIGYGRDEPPDTEEAAETVAKKSAEWHAVGMRTGSAISPDHANRVGGAMDILILHTPSLGSYVPDGKHELWAYNCQLRGTNAPLHRYVMGLYALAAHRRLGVKAMFLWSYVHNEDSGVFLNDDGSIRWWGLRVYEHALPGPNGPLPTVGLDGIREGIVDFKILDEAGRKAGNEGWLDDLVSSVPLDMWMGTDHPGGPAESSYFWDVPDLAKPNFDLDAIRAEACRRMHAPSPD